MSDETTDGPPGRGFGDGDPPSAPDDVEQALHEARERLAGIPAEVVVVNHVMGLYELAAIHLSSDEPDLGGSSLAIDAMAALVEGLGDRLGDDAPTMRDALAAIRMAYVAVSRQQTAADSD